MEDAEERARDSERGFLIPRGWTMVSMLRVPRMYPLTKKKKKKERERERKKINTENDKVCFS